MYFVMFIYTVSMMSTLCADDQYVRTLHSSIWAHFLHCEKKTDAAYDWYTSFIQQPPSLYSLKGYITFLFDQKKYHAIDSYISTMQTIFALDATMQRIAAHTLAQLGKQSEADALFIELNKKFPTNIDIAFEVVKILLQQDKIDEALAVTYDITNKTAHKQSVFPFFFLQAQLCLKKHAFDEARSALRQCLALRPNCAKSWLLLSVLEAQSSALDEKTFQNASTAMTPYQKAFMLYQQQEWSRALVAIDQCIAQEEYNPHYKLLKIQILIDMHNIYGAVAQLVAWIQREPEQQLWFSAMHLLTHLHIDAKTVIGTLEALRHTVHSLWLHIYLADLYMRTDQYADACVCLQRALACTSNPELTTEIYFSLGLLAYKQRDFHMLRIILPHAFAHNIVHPPLYNLAAYFYATKGADMHRAEGYVERALAQDPTNIHYQDTRAFIWYKKREYQKAAQLLTQLIANDASDATILLHLAKVQYKLGKNTEAYTLIQRACITAQNVYEKHMIAQLKQKWHLP
jgi:predicted Zn-dependent protease